MNIIDIITRLQSLTRYDACLGGDCECCGDWIDYEEDDAGDWVRFDDINLLIEELNKML